MLFSLRTDTKYVWRKQMAAKKLSINSLDFNNSSPSLKPSCLPSSKLLSYCIDSTQKCSMTMINDVSYHFICPFLHL